MRGPGDTFGNSWWGCAVAVRLSNLTPYFRPKNVIFHTRFKTWPSLLRLERILKKFFKSIWNSHIYIYIGIETINTFIPFCSSRKNHTRFQTKMGKVYTRFQTKTEQKPTQWVGRGGTYPYS